MVATSTGAWYWYQGSGLDQGVKLGDTELVQVLTELSLREWDDVIEA